MNKTRREGARIIRIGTAIVLVGLSVVLLIYVFSFILVLIPARYYKYEAAASVFIIMAMMIVSIRKFIRGKFSATRHRSGYTAAMYLLNMVSYFILAVVVLYALGINVYSVLLGSTFLAAILALGAQSILGNIFSGILLVFTRPLKIGDTVWIFPWNSSSALLGLQFAIFAPKYFSAEYLFSQGIVGRVRSITLNYLTIENESAQVSVVPNIVVAIGAFLLMQDKRHLSLRYELPKHTPPEVVRQTIIKSLDEVGVKGDLNFQIDETTLDTYTVRVSIENAALDHDERSVIMDMINRRIDGLRRALREIIINWTNPDLWINILRNPYIMNGGRK